MLNILGFGSSNLGSQPATSANAGKTGRISAFAEMLAELQQMEQSNPTQYSQVSQQISTNLSTAATTAQTQGDSSLAARLTTLSKDFASAAQTGQMPNMGDLKNVMSGSRSSADLTSLLGGVASSSTGGSTSATSMAHKGVLGFLQNAVNLAGF